MSVSSIASLSTALAANRTATEIGVTLLKRTIDEQTSSAEQLLSTVQAPTPAGNLPSNLGQNINTTA